jgi:hypothetical protein
VTVEFRLRPGVAHEFETFAFATDEVLVPVRSSDVIESVGSVSQSDSAQSGSRRPCRSRLPTCSVSVVVAIACVAGFMVGDGQLNCERGAPDDAP